jgi:hypothetical protein
VTSGHLDAVVEQRVGAIVLTEPNRVRSILGCILHPAKLDAPLAACRQPGRRLGRMRA